MKLADPWYNDCRPCRIKSSTDRRFHLPLHKKVRTPPVGSVRLVPANDQQRRLIAWIYSDNPVLTERRTEQSSCPNRRMTYMSAAIDTPMHVPALLLRMRSQGAHVAARYTSCAIGIAIRALRAFLPMSGPEEVHTIPFLTGNS